jgi:hypothetical protein
MNNSVSLHTRLFRAVTIIVVAAWFASVCNSAAQGAADPIAPGSWTLALLPDTQFYSQSFPNTFATQTQWIKDHRTTHNIKYALHVGDVVQNNPGAAEWDQAKIAMHKLDGFVPYAISPGNHDYGTGGKGAQNRNTQFNTATYFGPTSSYGLQPSVKGFYESGKSDNSYHTFSANNQKWLIVALEFGARDAVVQWANNVVASYADHTAILITHAYLYNDSTRYDWATKGLSQDSNPHSYGIEGLAGGVNDGQQLWDKLVSKHDNFRFVFNGHVLGDGTGYLASQGLNGNTVHQMLSNYQFLSEGGQGYMRYLEFTPTGNDLAVKVRTYSPTLDVHNRAADHEFSFTITPVPEPSAIVAALTGVLLMAILIWKQNHTRRTQSLAYESIQPA